MKRIQFRPIRDLNPDLINICIAGSRDINDEELVFSEIDKFINENKIPRERILIVSGMAKGVDYLGMIYGELHGLKVSAHPARWDLYGKRAGMVRNKQMAINLDFLLAIWDGKSTGTEHMINYCKSKNIETKVVIVNV